MAITIINLLYYPILNSWLYCLILGSWSYIYKFIFTSYYMILIYLLFKSLLYHYKVYGCILMLWPSGKTGRCCCYLLMANNWPSSIIMYCSVGCLCYLGGICSLYEGLLPKPRSAHTGHSISMSCSSRAEVGPFVHHILYIKRRWRPLQTDGQGRSLFIYGCPTISVGHIPIANDGIILVNTLYKIAKLTI